MPDAKRVTIVVGEGLPRRSMARSNTVNDAVFFTLRTRDVEAGCPNDKSETMHITQFTHGNPDRTR